METFVTIRLIAAFDSRYRAARIKQILSVPLLARIQFRGYMEQLYAIGHFGEPEPNKSKRLRKRYINNASFIMADMRKHVGGTRYLSQ